MLLTSIGYAGTFKDPGSAKRVTQAVLAMTKPGLVTLQKTYAQSTYADQKSHPGIGGSHDGQGPTRPHRRGRIPACSQRCVAFSNKYTTWNPS